MRTSGKTVASEGDHFGADHVAEHLMGSPNTSSASARVLKVARRSRAGAGGAWPDGGKQPVRRQPEWLATGAQAEPERWAAGAPAAGSGGRRGGPPPVGRRCVDGAWAGCDRRAGIRWAARRVSGRGGQAVSGDGDWGPETVRWLTGPNVRYNSISSVRTLARRRTPSRMRSGVG